MSEHTPKQHALIGMRHLENAVLDILVEAWNEEKPLGLWEIGKRTGIACETDLRTFQVEGGFGGSRVSCGDPDAARQAKPGSEKKGPVGVD